jgi:hypothetical protein
LRSGVAGDRDDDVQPSFGIERWRAQAAGSREQGLRGIVLTREPQPVDAVDQKAGITARAGRYIVYFAYRIGGFCLHGHARIELRLAHRAR